MHSGTNFSRKCGSSSKGAKVDTVITSSADLVIAVLHKVGEHVRIRDDKRLITAFNEAAKADRDIFGRFACHPQYHDCPLLAEILHILDMSGCIERFNATSHFYQATELTLGSEGAAIYNALSKPEQDAVNRLAEKIKDAFNSRREAS